jgi:formylglycine-generating enzyme required for sulfatase activity
MRRFLVTVSEFRDFIEQGGYTADWHEIWDKEAWHWKEHNKVSAPLGWEDQVLVPNSPVSGLSWFEAMAYCQWLSFNSEEYQYDLPTEAEWEYVARRACTGGRTFPWGDHMAWGDMAEANWAGCFLRRKTPVGMFPASTTRDGVSDLFGNVEEWCKDLWEWPGGDPLLALGTNFLEHYRPVFDTTGIQRVVRGGSTIRFSRLCRPSYRSRILQEGRYNTVGFRPVRRFTGTDGT